MNKLTRKIKDKGYSLTEFCKLIGFSLRWYRTHEKAGAKRYDLLSFMVDELESKLIRNGGLCYLEKALGIDLTSIDWIIFLVGIFVYNDIFCLILSDNSYSVLANIRSGCNPQVINCLTATCVGFVFNSPVVL